MAFPLPGVSNAELDEVMVGGAVFFLETGSAGQPRVFYSALVTEPVYRAVPACLD